MGSNQSLQVAHQPITMESQEVHPEARTGTLLVQTLVLVMATTVQTVVVVTTMDPILRREGSRPTARVEAWQELDLVVLEVVAVMVLLRPIILRAPMVVGLERVVVVRT